MTNEIVPVDWRTQIQMMTEAASAIDVYDAASNLEATEVLRDMKGLADRIEARRAEMNRPARMQIEKNNAEAKGYLDQLNKAIRDVKEVVGSWQKGQRDIARAEEDAREEALQRAIAEGRHQEAQEHLEAQLAPVERPWRAPGTSLRETWHAEVTDLRAYVEWAATEMARGSWEWLLPNHPLLDTKARQTKGESPIPGVKFVSTTSIAASGR